MMRKFITISEQNSRLVRSFKHVYIEQRDGEVEENVEQEISPDEFVNTPTPSVYNQQNIAVHIYTHMLFYCYIALLFRFVTRLLP